MIGHTQKVLLLLGCQLLAITHGLGEIPKRLSGGKYFEGGIVEFWKDGEWKAICDPDRNTWNKNAGDAVCCELRFMESLNTFHGDNQLWSVSSELNKLPQSFDCNGGEASLSSCKMRMWFLSSASHYVDQELQQFSDLATKSFTMSRLS